MGYRGGVSCKGQGERVLRASWGIFRKKKVENENKKPYGSEKTRSYISQT